LAGVAAVAAFEVVVFVAVVVVVFDEVAVVLSAALVLPFAVLVVVAFVLVVDVVGVCAITRLAQSTEPITNNRVFFMMILKLLSLSLHAANAAN
jgi:hypothetical protein